MRLQTRILFYYLRYLIDIYLVYNHITFILNFFLADNDTWRSKDIIWSLNNQYLFLKHLSEYS